MTSRRAREKLGKYGRPKLSRYREVIQLEIVLRVRYNFFGFLKV